MAIVNPNEDQKNTQQNPSGGPVSISGTAGASASAGQSAGTSAGASPVASNNAPQANQGYTDVGSYLNANQAGSQKLGQDVASNLTNKYTQTQGAIGNSANDVINQVNQGYVKPNEQLIQQVASNPTAAASDPNQVSAFQAQLNDVYGGPTNWADYGTQQGKVNEAQQYGGLTKTPGGLNVLTQELEGPQASQGVNQLDTMLLGGSPNAMQAVQSAADPYATLNDYLNSQNQAVTGAIGQGQTAAQQASQNALNAFTGNQGTLTNLNQNINQTAADRLSAAQAENARVQQALQGVYSQPVDTSTTTLGTYGGGSTPWYNSTNYSVGDLDQGTLASLGMTQDQWNALRGSMQQAGTGEFASGHNFGAWSPTSQIDISSYLNQQDPTAAINAGTVATPEQYQQMAAIQQLLGNKMPQDMAINPAMASQAGTAPTNFNQFDYQGALSSAQKTAAAEREAARQMASGLTSSAEQAHAESQHGGGFGGALKQIISHPGNAIGSAMNPMSWAANIQNLSKGQGPNPTNLNPFQPSTDNQATNIVNKIPQANAIDAFLNKNSAQG